MKTKEVCFTNVLLFGMISVLILAVFLFILALFSSPVDARTRIEIYDPNTGTIMEGDIDKHGNGEIYNPDTGEFMDLQIDNGKGSLYSPYTGEEIDVKIKDEDIDD